MIFLPLLFLFLDPGFLNTMGTEFYHVHWNKDYWMYVGLSRLYLQCVVLSPSHSNLAATTAWLFLAILLTRSSEARPKDTAHSRYSLQHKRFLHKASWRDSVRLSAGDSGQVRGQLLWLLWPVSYLPRTSTTLLPVTRWHGALMLEWQPRPNERLAGREANWMQVASAQHSRLGRNTGYSTEYEYIWYHPLASVYAHYSPHMDESVWNLSPHSLRASRRVRPSVWAVLLRGLWRRHLYARKEIESRNWNRSSRI
jgi:hypothetical protein